MGRIYAMERPSAPGKDQVKRNVTNSCQRKPITAIEGCTAPLYILGGMCLRLENLLQYMFPGKDAPKPLGKPKPPMKPMKKPMKNKVAEKRNPSVYKMLVESHRNDVEESWTLYTTRRQRWKVMKKVHTATTVKKIKKEQASRA